MTTQIAVRLPDEIVDFLDAGVADGRWASRAALVAIAVEREMRAEVARQDATVLVEKGAADDLDDLVAWSVAHAVVDG